MNEKWWYRYDRILKGLSEAERNNSDRIWFRFRGRNPPHWSGNNRARHCPNHRTLREYFAFLETQRRGELFTSRDQSHVNGNSDEAIRCGTLLPDEQGCSDHPTDVDQDREIILGAISEEGRKAIQSYLDSRVRRDGNEAQPVVTAPEGGSVDVNTPSTAAGPSTAGEEQDAGGGSTSQVEKGPNPPQYAVRRTDKDLMSRFYRRMTYINNKLSQEDKDNPQQIWYRFRSSNPPYWSGKNQPRNCPNHRYFREFLAFMELQRPNVVFSSRNPEHVQGRTDEEVRRGTLLTYTESSDDPTDVKQDRDSILENISEVGENAMQRYLDSTLGQIIHHAAPGRGRGRGTKRPRMPKTYTLTLAESEAQDLPVVMPGTSSSGQEEDEDESLPKKKHRKAQSNDSSDEDNAGLYVPTTAAATAQSGPSVTSTSPRLTTTLTEVYEDQTSAPDGSPPKMGENVAYDDPDDDLYDD